MSLSLTTALNTSMKWFRRAYFLVTVVLGSYVLLVTFAAIWLFSMSGSSPAQSPLHSEVLREARHQSQDKVAVLKLSGPIVIDDAGESWSLSSGIINAEAVKTTLTKLDADDSVKAVVLVINSPGGSAVASDELYQTILKVKEHKPVVAYFSQMAASGGYYIGAAATKIVAHPQTLTGSIGVIFNFYELSELYQKIGVTANVVKSGEFKDIGSESRALTEKERAQLQGLVDATYQEFVTAVAQGRQLDESRVRELADGRLYTGRQALELGLVDAVGTSDEAVDEALSLAQAPDAAVLEYSDQGFWQSLLSAQASNFVPSLSAWLLGITGQTAQSGLEYR